MPLLQCYDEAWELTPTPDAIEMIVRDLVATVPREDQFEFDVQATILRAAAREFHA